MNRKSVKLKRCSKIMEMAGRPEGVSTHELLDALTGTPMGQVYSYLRDLRARHTIVLLQERYWATGRPAYFGERPKIVEAFALADAMYRSLAQLMATELQEQQLPILEELSELLDEQRHLLRPRNQHEQLMIPRVPLKS